MENPTLLELARGIIERSSRGVGLWVRPDGMRIQMAGRADGAVELAEFAVAFAEVAADGDRASLARVAAMLREPIDQPQSAPTTT